MASSEPRSIVPGSKPHADAPNAHERILEAAIALLDAEGEAGVKVDRVADDAQVAKQTLYLHFGDRDGLICAAQAERYRVAMSMLADALTDRLVDCITPDDYSELLLSYAALALREGADRRRLRMQVLGSATTRPELQHAIRAAHREHVAALSRVVTFGQRRGWVTNAHSSTALTEMWFGIINGYHVVEVYAADDDVEPAGSALIDALSLLLFDKVVAR